MTSNDSENSDLNSAVFVIGIIFRQWVEISIDKYLVVEAGLF